MKTKYACPVTHERVEDPSAYPPVRDGHCTGLERRFEEEVAKVVKPAGGKKKPDALERVTLR
jgi:hypothetical protein